MSSRSFLGFSLGHGVSFALAFNFFLRWGFWLFFFFFFFQRAFVETFFCFLKIVFRIKEFKKSFVVILSSSHECLVGPQSCEMYLVAVSKRKGGLESLYCSESLIELTHNLNTKILY